MVRIQPKRKLWVASPPMAGGGAPMKYPVTASIANSTTVNQCHMRTGRRVDVHMFQRAAGDPAGPAFDLHHSLLADAFSAP